VLEPEPEVDPTLHIIEAKAEGLVDMLLAWTLPASERAAYLFGGLWTTCAVAMVVLAMLHLSA